jgi:hypothetical protein
MAMSDTDTGLSGATGEQDAPPAETIAASMTALESAETGPMTATRCAIASAVVSGDANLSGSAVGMISAAGSAGLERGCACVVMSEGDVAVKQGCAGLIMGKRVELEQSGGGVMIGGETEVRRGWIGLLLARKATLSEDSRVLFDWKAALILAAVMLGIFGVILVIAFILARRAMRIASELRSRLPHLPEFPHLPDMPHLPDWVHAFDRLRRSA